MRTRIQRASRYLIMLVAILVAGYFVLSLVSEAKRFKLTLENATRGGVSLPRFIEAFGSLFLPSSITESTTKKVTATFYASEHLPQSFVEHLKKDGMAARIDKAEAMQVRAELLAPGVEISGDAKQDKPLDSEAIPFEWFCRFKDRGTYEVTVRFAVLDPQSVVTSVGEVRKRIEVTTPGGMTQRWVWIAGLISGTVAFIGGVLAIIGFFRKKGTVAPAPAALPPTDGTPNPATRRGN